MDQWRERGWGGEREECGECTSGGGEGRGERVVSIPVGVGRGEGRGGRVVSGPVGGVIHALVSMYM